MRRLTLVTAAVALLGGCADGHPLSSGSYVPVDETPPADTLGIEGVNMNAPDRLVLVVLPERIERWPMSPVAEESWPTGCEDTARAPIAEMTWEGRLAPEEGGLGLSHLRVSAWCEAPQHLRLTSEDSPDWELLLGPFDPS